jgi:GT2 family glycosyltransferase
VRPEVFERIGGFDEGFNPYGWEDVDFGLRARKAGFAICLAPKAILYHEGGRVGRGRSLPEYERSKTRGYFLLVRRHATRGQWLCCLCLLPLRAVGLALSELLRGHWRVPLAQIRGALGYGGDGAGGPRDSGNGVGKLG